MAALKASADPRYKCVWSSVCAASLLPVLTSSTCRPNLWPVSQCPSDGNADLADCLFDGVAPNAGRGGLILCPKLPREPSGEAVGHVVPSPVREGFNTVSLCRLPATVGFDLHKLHRRAGRYPIQ